MSLFLPPTTSNLPEWVRKAALTVNTLLRRPFASAPSAPVNPAEGDGYYNTTTHKAQIWDGSVWQDLW